jgi:hypothetical protein
VNEQIANSEQPASKLTWISEGLVIASAPVGAYLLGLSYIAGYASFFQIPTEFISLNIATLFSIAGAITFVALMVVALFFLLFMFWPHSENPILFRVLTLFPLLALLYLQISFFGRHWHEWISTLLALLILIIQFFVMPLTQRQGSAYLEKLREVDKRNSSAPATVVTKFLRNELGRRIGGIWLWAWFALSASHSAGRFEAMWKREFLVPVSSPDTVVLSSYGDMLIVAPFDRKTKSVERSFSMLKKGEDPKLLLRWEVVGPLQTLPSAP